MADKVLVIGGGPAGLIAAATAGKAGSEVLLFDKNKLLFIADGKPVFYKTFSAFKDCGLIDQFIVTANEEDFDFIKESLGDDAIIVTGGLTRSESVKNALKHPYGITKAT